MEITLKVLHSAPAQFEDKLVRGDVQGCLNGYAYLHNIALEMEHFTLADEIVERMYEIEAHYPAWQYYVCTKIQKIGLAALGKMDVESAG